MRARVCVCAYRDITLHDFLKKMIGYSSRTTNDRIMEIAFIERKNNSTLGSATIYPQI